MCSRSAVSAVCAFVAAVAGAVVAAPSAARADVYNLKVVTDASPDYSDLDGMVHSITSRWDTDPEKLWAMFYWNHIARRQTNPMQLHGYACVDPVMQFNDYGYTMCSTIAGINCAIWQHMGYKARYWDIAVHTVPEVFYDGRWHMYDNSLSNLYTLCDGKTIAGVEDIGLPQKCDASGAKEERGHVALYHSLYGTSPNGFLQGADTIRDLKHLGQDTFNRDALKLRTYYTDSERGHRYILNLRDGETYARHYARLDAGDDADAKNPSADPAYFVPNGEKDGKSIDPDSKNYRYHLRGNGVRTFEPQFTSATLASAVYDSKNINCVDSALQPAKSGQPAETIFKIEGANVITSLKINGNLVRTSAGDSASVALSTNNGMTWSDVFTAESQGANQIDLKLIKEVNGAYEVLVKVQMQAAGNPSDVRLKQIKFETITQLNGKTQPRLNLGKNTVYVGAGEQTESVVLWPELQADRYKPMAVESKNIKTKEQHEGWNGVMGPAGAGEGYVIFKIDAPRDITRISQQARMYVRKPKSSIAFEHSFDGGKTWKKSYTFADTTEPWDDYHDEVTTDIPKGTKSVLVKYVLNDASLYSIRMEANHKVASESPSPLAVTFKWSERQADYSLVKRSHTQLVDHLPATYTIDVGGADHPVVDSLTIKAVTSGESSDIKPGYSDGKDAGGEKWLGKWWKYGENLAAGKPYTVSVPPMKTQWGAGDPDGKILTDGRVGSGYSGGASFKEGALWDKGKPVDITVDLGKSEKLAAFRIHIHGYPSQDAILGKVKDAVDVSTSDDGKTFTKAGSFDFNLHWKDVPVNYMWPDDERFAAYNHVLVLDSPTHGRYVRYTLKPSRMMDVTEVQALDWVTAEPFDLKIALPETK